MSPSSPSALFCSLALATAAVAQQAPSLSPAPASPAPAPAPRLCVIVSVDQMAGWVFDRGAPFFAPDGGFRRIAQGGVRFSQCAYQHACSETGPGHATIGTGAPAADHGIVRNTWWVPAEQKLVYCVQEPMPPLAEFPEGKDRGPGRLLVPTLGDGVKAHLHGSKVASVSWKDRSAILMGGGAADAVVWFEYSTGNLVTNTRWAKAVPAWLAAFDAQRGIDSFFGWRWERFGPPDAYADLVDDRPFEAPHGNGSKARTLPQPLTGGLEKPGPAFWAEVYASPVANTLVRLAAEAVVKGLGLGDDDVPDLLCVSFSATDLVGHQFGPDSVEARDTLLRLDREISLFLNCLDERVGAGRYALFLTADHGVGPVPEVAKAAGVDAGRGTLQTWARAGAEKALAEKLGAPPAGKRYTAHVGEFTLFLDEVVLEATRGARDPVEFRREAARIAAAGASAAPGIAAAIATADLDGARNGGDPLRRSLALALCPGRAGDVQLVPKPYWLDGATTASHGTPHAYDREVIGFAMAPWLAPGTSCADAVTPGLGTVWFAHVLGIPRPPAAVDALPTCLSR